VQGTGQRNRIPVAAVRGWHIGERCITYCRLAEGGWRAHDYGQACESQCQLDIFTMKH
jgi:hypothetical protein